MRPPWLRALTGCLQMVVRSSDDIEVEAGEVEVGELRERAFAELCQVLSDEQCLTLAWMTLADLAVWPQLPFVDAIALARYLETSGELPLSHPKSIASLADIGTLGALEILPVITGAMKKIVQPLIAPPVDLSSIRKCVNGFAKKSQDPIAFWEKWLRRVIPAAIANDPKATKSHALAALRATLNTPARWSYVASKNESQERSRSSKGLTVNLVFPEPKGRIISKLGTFIEYEPNGRKIETKFIPLIPIDPYRMGYLFHSVCMTDLLDDAFTGYYDSVLCTNAATGECWKYQRY